MGYRIRLLGIMLFVWLMGCSAPIPPQGSQSAHEQPLSSPISQKQTSLGQTLPISAQAVMAGRVIQLEIAQTPEQQALGLMYRGSMSADSGMLFPFEPARTVSFWMKNVLIPLDMVFLRKGKVQAIAANVPPCEATPCPTYGPSVEVDQVIELRGGRSAELGLKVGDQVTIQKLGTNIKP